jgi:DNA-binding XRE family transcriptional regulator
LLSQHHTSLEGVRLKNRLFPSEIMKIETERLPSITTLLLICKQFRCDIPDILDFFDEEERDIFYNRRVLEANSYTPTPLIRKEFTIPPRNDQ